MLINPELLDHVEEQRAFNENLAPMTAQIDEADIETPEGRAKRRAMLEPGGMFASEPVAEATDRTIPGPGGDLTIRVLVPSTVHAVYLSIHGGGMYMGNASSYDTQNWDLARGANVAVVSPEYRLAPEHPYPAWYDDCEAAASWLAKHAHAEFGTDRLLIGGESAGATLSAATLLRVRDHDGGMEHFHGANLAYGPYDQGMTPSQRLAGNRMPLMTIDQIEGIYKLIFPGWSREERRSPEVSPLYADLAGLCPALFTVGTLDPFLDDSVFMASRWELAGNETELAVYPEAPHGIDNFPTKMGQLAKDRIVGFVADHAKV